MEIKSSNIVKDELIISVVDEETILTPIKKKLLEDETITFTGVKKEHPQLNRVDLIVKGKNPAVSLKKAVKAFEIDLKEFAKLL
ncbi:MAG: RpoL/Rpb11 RNA polymerase subunit family protein [Candidatus Nanoarchaeia archaeon]|jgi:DNA-directed RNA polymerase subunit L